MQNTSKKNIQSISQALLYQDEQIDDITLKLINRGMTQGNECADDHTHTHMHKRSSIIAKTYSPRFHTQLTTTTV